MTRKTRGSIMIVDDVRGDDRDNPAAGLSRCARDYDPAGAGRQPLPGGSSAKYAPPVFYQDNSPGDSFRMVSST